MQLNKLSLDQSPPLKVSLRFFYVAPFFAILSMLCWLLGGEAVLSSRWDPVLLAVTHGMVLGFFATIMFGALQQMLPVVAGVSVRYPQRHSLVTFLLWVPGTALLMAAFGFASGPLFLLSAVLLAAGALYFIGVCARALLGSTAQSDSVPAMVFAGLALMVTVGLGVYLALGQAGWAGLWRPVGTNIHLSWGLLGWVTILIVGIAWQVVPMFQITPAYPARMKRLLPAGLFICLLARSVAAAANLLDLAAMIDAIIAVLIAVFALKTLLLQWRSSRKLKDGHRALWRLGCINMLLAVVAWGVARAGVGTDGELLPAVLLVGGAALAIVLAMLYKIIAFLIWLHLNRENKQRMLDGRAGIDVPNMKKIVLEGWIKRQYYVFLAAELLLVAALWWPPLSQVAAGAWIVLFVLLGKDLYSADRVYRRLVNSE